MRRLQTLILILSFFLLYGEMDFRLIPHITRLEYEVHDSLYFRLAPSQVGYEWLARMTRKSPPITINSLGLRGPEVDVRAVGRYRILAVGSSSALGSGVEDDETWTAVLEKNLRNLGFFADVMNAGNPGWGPYQHATFLKEEAFRYRPHAAVVMVAKGDFGFLPKGTEAERLEFLRESYCGPQK
jgi:hypothetical protein